MPFTGKWRIVGEHKGDMIESKSYQKLGNI